VIVTYHDGSHKGEQDKDNCHKYEIDPAECLRVKKFIHELDVPKMAMLGPGLNQDPFADRWIGDTLAAIGSHLADVGASLQESRTEWLRLENRTFAFVPSLPGISLLATRDGDRLSLTVTATPESAVAPPPPITGRGRRATRGAK
jgi:hypothetical protein